MNSIELCESISRTLPSLFECSPAPVEGARVRTPMLYPDGDIVDIFVLDRGDYHLLTDFGEALGWLRMQSISTRRTPRQLELIKDVCRTLGIELSRGQLTLKVDADGDMAEAVVRLAQAVVRVSDVWFTFRYQRTRQGSMESRAQTSGYSRSTSDEVESWLRDKRIRFERGVRQAGRSRKDWTIDYRVSSAERTSFVFLLSADSRQAVSRVTEHVVSGCVDLDYLKNEEPRLSFVSLFDDTRNVWRDEDFNMVSRLSQIAYWSQPDTLERILTTP